MVAEGGVHDLGEVGVALPPRVFGIAWASSQILLQAKATRYGVIMPKRPPPCLVGPKRAADIGTPEAEAVDDAVIDEVFEFGRQEAKWEDVCWLDVRSIMTHGFSRTVLCLILKGHLS